MNARSGALRRRRKPSLATRFKIAWVFIVMAVAAAVYGGYVLVTLPQLRVAAVDVHIGGLAVTERDVLAAANIDRHTNIWLLDTADIARRVEAIPYVDRAAISRTPPARFAIDVTLREPVACVRGGARVVTVDSDARILQAGCARVDAIQIALPTDALGRPGAYARIPVLATLLSDGRELQRARVSVSALRQDRFGQLVAVGAGGIEMLFGNDSDLGAKAKLVAPVLAATRSGPPIRALDLRAPATPTVEYR